MCVGGGGLLMVCVCVGGGGVRSIVKWIYLIFRREGGGGTNYKLIYLAC